MTIIKKKIWPEYFDAVFLGKKKYELRLNDFEIPSLAPNKSKLSLAGSLGNIKSATEHKIICYCVVLFIWYNAIKIAF